MNKRIGIATGLGVLGLALYFLFFAPRKFQFFGSSFDTHQTNLTAMPDSSPTSEAVKTIPENPKTNIAANFPEPANPPPLMISISRKAAPAISVAPEFTNLPPATVMENLRTTFRSYQSMFRENPVGTNPEITKALNGGNRKQAHFLSEEDGMRINASGEMIDSWGTPYFFHQLSGTEMEIHSAGPDRIMWTKDDLVVR